MIPQCELRSRVPQVLTEQSSSYSLQHSEDREEVQSSIDALKTVGFAQTTRHLLHQQRTQHHH